MTTQEKDRIECAIRHIQTAVDVDPWAVEIAVEAMRKELSKNSPKLDKENGDLQHTCKDTIRRQDAIDVLGVFTQADALGHTPKQIVEALPSAQPEYELVKAEDFAKTMSENTLYTFMAWHCEALELMERQGFVICKKTTRFQDRRQ